jgi:O-antigen/teichoic acid export membrane protein
MTLYQSGGAGDDDHLRALRWRAVYRSSSLTEQRRWQNVYASASAARPRNRLARLLRRDADLLTNSGALMGSAVLSAGMGFVYWWVAARAFSPEAVGAASAAISAMTLIGSLGMFGLGTLLISELPRMERDQWSLVSTCVAAAGVLAAIGGLIYVGLAEFAFSGLRAALGSPLLTILLVLGIALNAMTLVLDEGLIGLLSGPLQLMRNLYFAVGKLILLVVLAVLPFAVPAGAILATWLGGIGVSLGLLLLTLRRRNQQMSLRPRWEMLRGRIGPAFEHNLLNMALFLPRTTLPLMVTAVLSVRDTAAFYTAWMVYAFAAMIPSYLATTLFAVSSGDRVALRSKVRTSLIASLGLGVPVTLVVAVAAHPIMQLFGSEYASIAAGALSILALTYVPAVFRQLFVGVARVLGWVRRATVFAIVAGAVEMAAAGWGGTHGGLTTMALWLAVVFGVEGALLAPFVLRVALVSPAKLAAAAAAEAAAGPGKRSGSLPSGEVDETALLPRLGSLPSGDVDATALLPRLPPLGGPPPGGISQPQNGVSRHRRTPAGR